MSLLTVIEDDDFVEPEYHSGILEDVLYQIEGGQVHVLEVTPSDPSETRSGTTTCEKDHGCLDYLIGESHIRNPQDGYYIMERNTCTYSQDYWGECDVDFEGDPQRPALLSEIPDKITLRIFWDQLKLAWKHAQHMEL